MTRRVRCLQRVTSRGETWEVGAEVDVLEATADRMVALGVAEDLEAPDAAPEPPAEPPPDAAPERRRRKQRRRRDGETSAHE